jgi:hypothetical protein
VLSAAAKSNAWRLFPSDYVTARQQFRELAAKLAGIRESYPIDGKGPSGEELAIDLAAVGPANADRLLVVSSGLHGVEGPFGSAVQQELMRRWIGGDGPPADVRCLLIHALNPFGFAWARRCDEQNIDPNRNFLLRGEAYSGSDPMYGRLDALLNPQRPPSRGDMFLLRAAGFLVRHGKASLKQAIAAGQYDYPQGIFYGGSGPSQTMQMLAQYLPSWIGSAKSVAHLDFHTGLGDWGSSKLLIDHPLTPAERQRLADWFGDEAYEENGSRGVAYRSGGSLGQWCRAEKFASDYVYACAEFGTYGNIRVLAGLRAENQAHHWADPYDASVSRSKANLRELFCPASPSWRSRVLEESGELVDRAIAGLQRES